MTNPPPGGGNAFLPHVFNVENLGPVVTRVFPDCAHRGDRLSLMIEGMNFASDVTRVSFGEGLCVDSITVASASQLRLLLLIPDDAAIGTRSVTVFNPPPGGGTATLPNGFLITSRVATALGVGDHFTNGNFEMAEPYPNPFNPSVRIRFVLPELCTVRLMVYNTLGMMKACVLDEARPIGLHEVNWSASNFPSGVYFIQFHAVSLESRRGFISFKKVILMK